MMMMMTTIFEFDLPIYGCRCHYILCTRKCWYDKKIIIIYLRSTRVFRPVIYCIIICVRRRRIASVARDHQYPAAHAGRRQRGQKGNAAGKITDDDVGVCEKEEKKSGRYRYIVQHIILYYVQCIRTGEKQWTYDGGR